ncbi:hypothetical protein VM1G_08332 [Cytospora mali]|uniref:Fungal N-terminal domain-containing protein n=1 Tax=Cytospora mali TaxID=578113 RepID=A0A194W937_CYTMA|nr:hypothetical protein VM1G_08332 [Valsa mali]
MDPLSAFSLAASILQFIDVGVQVVSGSVEIYQSVTGASALHDEAEVLAANITVIGDHLGKSLRLDGIPFVLGKYETHLEGLRLRSQDLAQELLDALAKLKIHVTSEHDETRKEVTAAGKEIQVTVAASERRLTSQNLEEHERTRKELQETKDELIRQIGGKEVYFKRKLRKLNWGWQKLSEKERRYLKMMQNERIRDICVKICVLESIEKQAQDLAAGSSSSASWKTGQYPTPRMLAERLPDMSSEPETRQHKRAMIWIWGTGNETALAFVVFSSKFSHAETAFAEYMLPLNVEDPTTDKDFFKLLEYTVLRDLQVPGYFDTSLEELGIAELYADDHRHVRVTQRGEVPEANDSRWQYFPKPMDVIPPVGDWTLYDYARNHDRAGNRRAILDRIPKATLSLGDLLPDSHGKLWGLYLQCKDCYDSCTQ